MKNKNKIYKSIYKGSSFIDWLIGSSDEDDLNAATLIL